MFHLPEKGDKQPGEGGLAEAFGGAGHHLPGETGEDGATEVRIDQYAIKVQKARDAAQADPKAVANILKDWIDPSGS
jgi:flagellar M-ring protein FliF